MVSKKGDKMQIITIGNPTKIHFGINLQSCFLFGFGWFFNPTVIHLNFGCFCLFLQIGENK
jgi:hypothetical protein